MNSSPESFGTLQDVVRPRVFTFQSDFEDARGTREVIPVREDAPALLLFDIDGTLIDAKSIHGTAVVQLFTETFPNSEQLHFEDTAFARSFVDAYQSYWGLGDAVEFGMLCDTYNLPVPREETERTSLLNTMAARYGTLMQEELQKVAHDPEMIEKIILPGVIPFLEEMRKRNVPAALVTGNSETSARSFMKALGLGKYFITGGYDSDMHTTEMPFPRATIFESAVTKCKQRGVPLPKNVVVFGDTPKDLKATEYGAGGMRPHVFLVATGTHTQKELASVRTAQGKNEHLAVMSFEEIHPKDFFDTLEHMASTQSS